ncbi:uncharacterized protein LOC134255508 [Saccostrea cucullata]|uniref:uncharacterized protein LOC134255508 n=1 Tax=Saccostrea cuccullata TaxID=36930 RepID=UPI002ED02D96
MEQKLRAINTEGLTIELGIGKLEDEYPNECFPVKFKPRNGKAKYSRYEEIDENLYEETAKMVCFYTSEKRLFYWIKACNILYYDNVSNIEGIDVKWSDNPQTWEDPNGGNSITIELLDQENLLYNVTIFISTGTIRVQGHYYQMFSRHHFPILKGLVSQITTRAEETREETRVKEVTSSTPIQYSPEPALNVSHLKVLQSTLIQSIDKLQISIENNTSSIIDAISKTCAEKIIKTTNTESLQQDNIVLKSQLQQEKEAFILKSRQLEESSKHLKQMLSDTRDELNRANSQVEYLSNKLSNQREELEALDTSNRELKCKLSEVQDELINMKSGILSESTARDNYKTVGASSNDNEQILPSVLLLGTSNVRNINEKVLTSAVSTTKYVTYTIEDATKFIGSCTSTYNAIILHILTNNIKNDEPNECVTKLQKLVAEIKTKWPATKLILSLTTPRNDGHQTASQLVNAMVKQQLLLEKEENVSFIEHHNMFDVSGGGPNLSLLSEDGYHLNERGVSKLAVNLRNAIHTTLKLGLPVNNQFNRSRSRQKNRFRGFPRGRGSYGRGSYNK